MTYRREQNVIYMGWLKTILLVSIWSCMPFMACLNQSPADTKPKSDLRSEVISLNDSDQDGIPDALELHTENDRRNFRTWFTSIASQQFYEQSKVWNEEQRDCSGLVRFAWREALRKHDRVWLQKMGAQFQPLAPDVAAYSLERNLVGEKIFRTKGGPFLQTDIINGVFNDFADASTLKQYNSAFISRDKKQAQPGDLLFFYQPFTQRYPYHIMIFLGSHKGQGDQATDWVVYHTGGSAEERGEVRLVRLSSLAKHPNPKWRPVESNQNYLGFFRLNILN